MSSSKEYISAINDAAMAIHTGDVSEAHKYVSVALARLKSIPTSDMEDAIEQTAPEVKTATAHTVNADVAQDIELKENKKESVAVEAATKLQTNSINSVGTESIAKTNASKKSEPLSQPNVEPVLSSLLSQYPSPPPLTTYTGKIGRSAHTSPYSPSTPILPNSQVAYKPKSQPDADWILCRVLKVLNEVKFEIQDPEPDDLHPHGAVFKATAKEVILIPLHTNKSKPLRPYKPGTKVLAKYPETTVFYPAEVVECGTAVCMLRFEGEEEENKLTAVDRPFVLPT